MNFALFKRRGSNSVQDQSLWNWPWTEWHRDGFLFDYIGFPLSASSHQCSMLICILILPLSGQADEDWEPDIRRMIAVLTLNFRVAEHCLSEILFCVSESTDTSFFFTLLRHKVVSVLFAQNFVNVYKIWGLHYSEDSFHGILNVNTVWTWWVLISVS